jgi:hypothetical protein
LQARVRHRTATIVLFSAIDLSILERFDFYVIVPKRYRGSEEDLAGKRKRKRKEDQIHALLCITLVY